MHFLTQILFPIDGAEPSKEISAYADADSAEVAYHTALAAAIGGGRYDKAILIIIDSYGNIAQQRVWE